MKFNLNDYVKVKITPLGERLAREARKRDFPELEEQYPFVVKRDKDGWTRDQLWVLMSTYGPFMHNGAKPAVETGVELEDGGVLAMLQRLEWVDGYCPVCDGGQYDRSSENPGRVCKDYHFGHHEGCEMRALLDRQGVTR